jgi:hypothetical protein
LFVCLFVCHFFSYDEMQVCVVDKTSDCEEQYLLENLQEMVDVETRILCYNIIGQAWYINGSGKLRG